METTLKTVDTLGLAKELRQAEFSEKQAEAIVGAVRKVEEHHLASLVTKADLKEALAKQTMAFAGILLAQTALIISLIKFV